MKHRRAFYFMATQPFDALARKYIWHRPPSPKLIVMQFTILRPVRIRRFGGASCTR